MFKLRKHAITKDQRYDVLDVGSCDVNGTYRSLFEDHNYVGMDVAAGKNVDIVVKDHYNWREIADASFDVVISGQCLEHVEFPWLTVKEAARVLRPGGTFLLIVPSAGPVHRYPVDCYRYYPDGLRALAKWAELTTVHCGFGEKSQWNDVYLVAQK